MFSTVMYQQPMIIQFTDEELHQHCNLEHKENAINYTKGIPHHSRHTMQDGSQHHYQYHKSSGKKHWTTNNMRNIRILSGFGHGLSQSQEALSMQSSSQDSLNDSSYDEMNGLSSKGTKRLHELNGSQLQTAHPLSLNAQSTETYQLRRSHNSPTGYQPHQKRRHYVNKFGSPPHLHRNKYCNSGGNNYQLAPDRYLARSELIEVRDTPKQLVTGNQWDQLSKEIWKKFIGNQQTSENYVKKMNLFKHLYTHIKVFLRYSVFVVGSTFNGFGTNSSDLDLCLVIRSQHLPDIRADAINHLIHTQVLLSRLNYTSSEFQNLELIEAKVPLLKFQHSLGVNVDINCNNLIGIHNTHLLHCYAKADWRVQPLVLIVKIWASTNQINNAKNMTISSYSLSLMVIHFLQCGTKPVVLPCLQKDFPEKFEENKEIHEINIQETLSLPPSTNTQSLGELLLLFFEYYNSFKFAEYAISVRLGTVLPIEMCRRHPSPKNEPRAWSYLCIEEPFDHTNTARAVYDASKFEHIRKVIQVSYQSLKKTLTLSSIFQLKCIS